MKWFADVLTDAEGKCCVGVAVTLCMAAGAVDCRAAERLVISMLPDLLPVNKITQICDL